MKEPPMKYSRKRVARQRIGANIFRLFSVVIFVSHLAGCASTRLLTMEERTAVGTGEKAIVLLRVQCTIERQQHYAVFRSWPDNNINLRDWFNPFQETIIPDSNINFGLGSFESGGEPEPLELMRFLSPESRRNGWTYFVLPHGIHYLTVYLSRADGEFFYQQYVENAPCWRIDIPQDAKLVYAGTLHFTGESKMLDSGYRIIRSIRFNEMSVKNEEEMARKLLTEKFSGFGEAQTHLMRLQQGPIILRSPLPSLTK